MTTELIDRARSGDEVAFSQLVGPYQTELQLHCYRILGSVHDAEDALQETLLAAWQGLNGFEQRASIRTWLYKVATSRCLQVLRAARRRPQVDWPPRRLALPDASGPNDVTWLEPYPDALLAGLADTVPGPEARMEAAEAISLAFITALQLLPPRQRAALMLRDVLGFHASEVAEILDSTTESVTSALKRARATVQQHSPGSQPPPPPGSAAEQQLVARLTAAYETGSVDELVALVANDVLLAMPPIPLIYQGRTLVGEFLATFVFAPGNAFRLVAVRANGQPALGMYLRDPDGVGHANGVMVFTLAGHQISTMTRFDTSVLAMFKLPDTLPA